MNYLIESERLYLRKFNLSDAEAYYQMTRDTDIQKYVEYACAPTLEETIENIDLSYSQSDFVHDYYLLLEDKNLHKIVGAILATESIDSSVLEVCILTHPEFRKKGYMTEALNTFIKYLPTGKILSFCINYQNFASLKTISKLPNVQEVSSNLYRIFQYTV